MVEPAPRFSTHQHNTPTPVSSTVSAGLTHGPALPLNLNNESGQNLSGFQPGAAIARLQGLHRPAPSDIGQLADSARHVPGRNGFTYVIDATSAEFAQ